MAGGGVRVTASLVIPDEELTWRFTASGGPGGQHANRANTRVEVRFDIATSSALGPRQRARLLERIGPSVRIVVTDERSQARNRDLALDRLARRLRAALARTPVRRPTTPSAAANERRLQTKRRQSERKRRRRDAEGTEE